MDYYKKLIISVFSSFILLFSEQVVYPFFYVLTFYPSVFLMGVFYDVSYSGNIIMIGGKLIEIIPECVGVLAYVLLSILILLTRDIKLRKGLKMFFFGSIFILLFNILRIVFLGYLFLNYDRNYFNSIHILLWMFMSGFYVGAVWIFLSWRFKIKNIPLVSDVSYLLNKIRSKNS